MEEEKSSESLKSNQESTAEVSKQYVGPTASKNLLEATATASFLIKLAGQGLYKQTINADYQVVASFSWLGFGAFLFFHSLYFYCVYQSYAEKQSVVRIAYDTRLKHYGDVYELCIGVSYSIFIMWRLPFSLSKDTKHLQLIVDVDREIKTAGLKIRYAETKRATLQQAVGIFVIWILHFVTLVVTSTVMAGGKLSNWHVLYQRVFFNIQSVIVSAHYIHYFTLIHERFKVVNNELLEMQPKILEGRDTPLTRLEAKRYAYKLRELSKIYGHIHHAGTENSKSLGISIVVTIMVWLLRIVLDFFYVMEAHAIALFSTDAMRYSYLMMAMFWDITFGTLIVFLSIHVCEQTLKEGNHTPRNVHIIINDNVNNIITEMAVRLSRQLIHQPAAFKAGNLYKLEYLIMMFGARMVFANLLLLIKFVTRDFKP